MQFGKNVLRFTAIALTQLVFIIDVAGAPIERSAATSGQPWLIKGTRVYVGPDQPPLDNAWVLLRDGLIEAVGAGSVAPPAGVPMASACSGGIIAAGFQNSHVHFLENRFANAATRPATELADALAGMLTRYGYTTVVDTGSALANTVALRQRIVDGAIDGPQILSTGMPLFPGDGIPIYLKHLPAELIRQMPEPATVEEATAIVRWNVAHGAKGTKLFAASPMGDGKVQRMNAPIARAVADETHRLGGLVMAHPTDPDGVRAAVSAGVDIVVHTTIDPPNSIWSDQLIADMVAHRVSVIPTLKLWHYELNKENVPRDVQQRIVGDAQTQLKRFVSSGGQVLFGTDVGYMSDADPREEYVLMAGAGMTAMQILASLTTAPAARWHADTLRGRVAPGMAADLVVLDGDPAADVKYFADVKCTVRAGRIIFARDLH